MIGSAPGTLAGQVSTLYFGTDAGGIEDVGLSFIFGALIPDVPPSWPGGAVSTPAGRSRMGTCSPQPWPAEPCGMPGSAFEAIVAGS